MRTAERLARLEGGRAPAEVVVAWAEQAHGWHSLGTYDRALLDPEHVAIGFGDALDRMVGAIGRSTARPRIHRHATMRAAWRDAVFLHELVRLLDDAVSRWATDLSAAGDRLAGGLDRLFPDTPGGPATSVDPIRAKDWLRRSGEAVRAHDALELAVRTLEARHLLGAEVTFPDTRRRWQAATDTTEDLRQLAVALVCHLDPADEPSWAATDTQVAALVRELELAARVDTHLWLGELERARELLARAAGPALASASDAPIDTADDGDLRSPVT